MERLGEVAMTSEPAGFLPRDLTAKRAGAASGHEGDGWGEDERVEEEKSEETFGRQPGLLVSVGSGARKIGENRED